MAVDILKRWALFVVLCMVQVLFLNHIWLFDVATPLLYMLFVITFRRNTPKWAILLWSFCLGLTIDTFTNTPGLASGCLTLTGMMQPYLAEVFLPKDAPEDIEISMRTLGISKFATLSLILTGTYCLIFFALEAFSFYNLLYWVECSVFSTALTMALLLAVESVRSK